MCRPNQTTIKINTYFSSAPFLAHMIDNTYTMLYIQRSKVKGQYIHVVFTHSDDRNMAC